MSNFTAEEKSIIALYKSEEYGQGHLFAESIPAEAQKTIIAQLKTIGESLPKTGKHEPVLDYIKRARTLLTASAKGTNPYAGYKVEVPTGVTLNLDLSNDSSFLDNETIGIKNIHKCAFVLVAGGLGERLGYDGIKLELPVDLVSSASHIQWYIETILAYEANQHQTGLVAAQIPLVIMTSDDTHFKTVELLEKNKYFGANPAQVTLVKQAKVPALIDSRARFALVRNAKGEVTGIETKPHGHGDVHSLLRDFLPGWQSTGIQHVVFIQDTNSLIFNAIPAALGVSINKNFTMNTIAIDRRPGEAVGALANLVKEDGSRITINVEYNQINDLLTSNNQTEPIAESGFSELPGNTNAFIVALPRYAEVLAATGGILGEFVNPKYADETKTLFKSSARLETLMQDLPKGLKQAGDFVGFTKFERWLVFSPVKNSIADAKAKIEAGIPPECAFSAEADRYACYTEMLKRAVIHSHGTFEADEPVEQTYFDITYKVGPKVVIHPSFATCMLELIPRVAGSKITIKSTEPINNSTLILQGNAQIVQINLQGGTFAVSGGPKRDGFLLFVDEEHIQNKGWFLESTVGSIHQAYLLPPPLRIRGYTLHRAESRVLHAQFDEDSFTKKKAQQKCCF